MRSLAEANLAKLAELVRTVACTDTTVFLPAM